MSDGNDNVSVKNGDGSAPVNPNSTSGKIQLSDREQEILSKAWSCMKVQPEIDYVRLASATGMTNPRSASNAWSALKKKLFTGIPPATPAKAKAADGGDSEKKRKRVTPKKKAVKAEGDGDDMDAAAVETPVKKKRTPAKKKAVTSVGNAEAAAAAPETAAVEAKKESDEKADVKVDDQAEV